MNEYYSLDKSRTLLREIWGRRRAQVSSNHINDSRFAVLDQIVAPETRALEVGTGPGTFLEALHRRYKLDIGRVHGVDLDHGSVEVAQERGLSVRHANVEQDEIGTSKYDLVMAFELIEHLIDPLQFLAKARRALVDSGYLFMSTPNSHGLDNIAMGYNFEGRYLAHPSIRRCT
ncbi:class I SAM-dependent methyltransferase [Rhodothermus sp. AH-315-K08]|nr:class I SAM-dependent methyltransferase [Rhodothermus sp. AH-315-K08]